jgi:hypothetical protein
MTAGNDDLDTAVIAFDRRRSESRIKLIPFDEVKLNTEQRYLVKRLIPRTGLCLAWGSPKCGKSFWAFDLAMHVAIGKPYRGRHVQGGAVVYCAFEGSHGFGARIEAFRQKHLPDDPVLLIRSIKATLNEHPVLLILDTLNRSLRGSESSDEDMTAYIRAADIIREAFGCAVLIVHHCGIDGTRPRGHTSLIGAVDAQLAVKRDGAGNIEVKVEHMKDGPEGDTLYSRLDAVEVGVDEYGEPITSCIVVPVDAGAARPTATRKLSDKQKLALEVLADCVLENGEPLPTQFKLPDDLKGVAISNWREEMLKRGVLDSAAKNPREDYRRVKTSLLARHLIGERDGSVWLAKQGD